MSFLQAVDTVDWLKGRASGSLKNPCHFSAVLLQNKWVGKPKAAA